MQSLVRTQKRQDCQVPKKWVSQPIEALSPRRISRVMRFAQVEYEGTSRFLVTASSAKIGFGKVNLQPLEGEVP
jgi:hypothetical protein